jgi:hypothetical protein
MPILLADPELRAIMEAFALIQINAGEAPGALDRGARHGSSAAGERDFSCCQRYRAADSRDAGPGVAMPNQPGRFILKDHPLGVAIAAALTVKAVALAVLYFAFFVPPPNPTPPAERAATAILGLPGR